MSNFKKLFILHKVVELSCAYRHTMRKRIRRTWTRIPAPETRRMRDRARDAILIGAICIAFSTRDASRI